MKQILLFSLSYSITAMVCNFFFFFLSWYPTADVIKKKKKSAKSWSIYNHCNPTEIFPKLLQQCLSSRWSSLSKNPPSSDAKTYTYLINRDFVPIYRFRAWMIKEEEAQRIISTNYTNVSTVINQFCNLQNWDKELWDLEMKNRYVGTGDCHYPKLHISTNCSWGWFVFWPLSPAC